MTEQKNIVIDVRVANKLCRDALVKYANEQGLKDITCEGFVEKAFRNGKFLNCKRRGIVLYGTECEDSVPDKPLSYRELQIKAKSLGIKATGTPDVLLAKIEEKENEERTDKD
jgi:hypothetical protein